jgi:hypothetical protein
MEFTREFAVLNNKGMITQDLDTLVKYGYPRRRYRRRKFRIYKHTNTFAMRRKIFWELNGYSEKRCDTGTHPTHDDLQLNSEYRKYAKQGKCSKPVLGPITYCFPAVDKDPKKLFHNLQRGTREKRFYIATAKESLDHLASMMDNHKKVYYVRYGDGEFRVMNRIKDRWHKTSPQIRKELKQSILIRDSQFIKAASLGYPPEQKPFRQRLPRIKSLRNIAAKYTNEKHFYNPIVFHYLAACNPDVLMHFINKYIKPKTKMFIGCSDKTIMESLYGKIDYYIQIPESQAYYTINEWWPDVEKNAKKCEVILPSAGIASCVIQKRLWNLDIDAHCIDIGSINDAVEGKVSRGWIKRIGVERLKRNLNV